MHLQSYAYCPLEMQIPPCSHACDRHALDNGEFVLRWDNSCASKLENVSFIQC